MRLVLAMVFAGFAALPFSVSAQSEAGPSEPNLQEPAPSSEPAPQEPALQLQLDDDSVKLVPSPPPTVDGYTLEEMKLRVKRARIGLLSSAGAFLVGIPFLIAAGTREQGADFVPEQGADPVKIMRGMGVVLYAGGAVGMIASGIMLGKRNRKLDRFEPAAWTVDGYTLEEMKLRVKRARIGLGVSALSTVVGIALSAAAGAQRLFCFEPCSYPGWVDPVFAIGLTLAAGGAAGMIASGILFGKRKRKLRRLQHAHYGTPRRVHWDLAQSRLVF